MSAHCWSCGAQTLGLSATAIATNGREGKDHPWDPSDFWRCERYLRQHPEARERFAEMARLSPQWAALVPEWDRIVTVLDAEVPGIFDMANPDGRAPVTYRLMRRVLESA